MLLGEDYFERFMPNGDTNIDFKKLPGATGVQVPRRLTNAQMEFLTIEYGVEFAQVYQLGPGKNGGGGKYIVFSGAVDKVEITVGRDIMLINHTHPGGTASSSDKDRKVLRKLAKLGSPQKTSAIIPIGKPKIYFTKEGVKNV